MQLLLEFTRWRLGCHLETMQQLTKSYHNYILLTEQMFTPICR